MRIFPLLIFSLALLNSNGQTLIGNRITETLEESQLYIVAQSHNSKANTIIEQEILLALNKKYKVRFDILEYAHSVAFIINQYLQTGQDSLLALIDPEASFKFIRSVKAHNDSVGAERKIKFYGVDFENRNKGKYTIKAIAIILEQLNVHDKGILRSILRETATSPQDLYVNLEKIRDYLTTNEKESRLILGSYFVDVLLIANAQYDFTPNRDEAMVNNFKRLYNELERNEEYPMFFASFGVGHVNPKNSNGIAMKLLHDERSPVRNSVSVIGIEYLNCRFKKGGVTRPTEGSLNFLCKNAVIQNLPSAENDKESITFLAKEDLNKLNCKKEIEQLSGLIIVRNYDAARFWTWE